MQTRIGPIEFFPTKKFKITIDSARIVDSGTLSPEYADRIVDEIKWTINRSGVTKSSLMVLDLLATNNWERPVYFAITTGNSAYIGLEDYFQIEGLAYRLVPMKTKDKGGQIGSVNTDVMYDNLMNKYKFGNINDPDVYLDETNMRMAMNIRNNFYRLSEALISEGKKDSAKIVMDQCLKVVPDNVVPYDYFIALMINGYYEIGEIEKGYEIASRLTDIMDEQLNFYFSFTGRFADKYDFEKQQNLAMLQKIMQDAERHKIEGIESRAAEIFDLYYKMYLEQ